MVGSSEKRRATLGAGRMRRSLVRYDVVVLRIYGFPARRVRVQPAVVAQPRDPGRPRKPPSGWTSKCRCGPVVLPVIPIAPTWSPAYTVSPTDHAELRHVVVPGDGAVLVPDLDLLAVGACLVGEDPPRPSSRLWIGVPIGAAKSRPVWLAGPAATALTEGRGDVVAGDHDLAAGRRLAGLLRGRVGLGLCGGQRASPRLVVRAWVAAELRGPGLRQLSGRGLLLGRVRFSPSWTREESRVASWRALDACAGDRRTSCPVVQSSARQGSPRSSPGSARASELWLNPTAPAAAASVSPVKPTICVLLGVLRLATRCLALRSSCAGFARSVAGRVAVSPRHGAGTQRGLSVTGEGLGLEGGAREGLG